MTKRLSPSERAVLVKAMHEHNRENETVRAIHAIAQEVFKTTGGDGFARDAAYDCAVETALKGGDIYEIWGAGELAGRQMLLDPQKLASREGKRLNLVGTVEAFRTKARDGFGWWTDRQVYLANICDGDERLGNQWFNFGKAWRAVSVSDRVTFRASVENRKIKRPAKVEILQTKS